jgi:hypothetical protein
MPHHGFVPIDYPVFELAPQRGYDVDPERLAWPETRALAAALAGYTFEIETPEYFCPGCVRRQPVPGWCGLCSMVREAFPLT